MGPHGLTYDQSTNLTLTYTHNYHGLSRLVLLHLISSLCKTDKVKGVCEGLPIIC